MAKHGTLPEYIYQRHCIRSDQPINITFEEADQDEEHAPESEGSGEDSQTEGQAIGESGSEPEYDESSDEDEDEVGASDESGNCKTLRVTFRMSFNSVKSHNTTSVRSPLQSR